MRRAVLLLAVPLVLAGCGDGEKEKTTTVVTKDGTTTTTTTTRTAGKDDDDDDADDKTITGLKIDTDKFKANLEIPGLSFDADDMDMDGMKLYPGSKVKGMRVNATDRDGDKQGTVTMDFTSPAAAATVADHMVAEAKKEDFTVSGVSAGGFSGTKVEGKKTNSFTVTLKADGDRTVGQMAMTGSKVKSGWN